LQTKLAAAREASEAVHVARAVSDALASGSVPDDHVVNALHNAVWELRRALYKLKLADMEAHHG
jgi:transcription initiation factor IIE alpha subunit